MTGVPAVPWVGTYIFTLRKVDGQLKIATIVFDESHKHRSVAATNLARLELVDGGRGGSTRPSVRLSAA